MAEADIEVYKIPTTQVYFFELLVLCSITVCQMTQTMMIFPDHFTDHQRKRIIHHAFTFHKQKAPCVIEPSRITVFHKRLFMCANIPTINVLKINMIISNELQNLDSVLIIQDYKNDYLIWFKSDFFYTTLRVQKVFTR